MMRIPVAILFAILGLVISLYSPASHAAQVSASVSNNHVAQHEIFQLRITTDQNVSRDAVDFSVLASNFDVSSPRFGTAMNWINGKRTVRSEWTVSLSARTAGQVIIPAFEIQGARSQPITLQVSVDQQAFSLDDIVDTQVTLGTDTLYPNEHTLLNTRVSIKTDQVQLQDLRLQPPSIQGLELKPIGEPKQSQQIQNGVNVAVVEQDYELTAQDAGHFSLQGPVFKGVASYDDPMTFRRKQVNVTTTPKTFAITVLPKPTNYTGVWLPASALTLTQQWQDNDGHEIETNTPYATQIGEPITRTITLDITGVNAEYFPNIAPTYPTSVRAYSEKPHYQTLKNGITRMTLKQVLIPQRSGEIALDGAQVDWWDSQHRQPQSSKLTGLTLHVAASDAGSSAQNRATGSAVDQNIAVQNTADQNRVAPQNDTTTVPPATTDEPTAASNPSDASLSASDNHSNTEPQYWRILTAIFALLWLITAIIALRYYRLAREARQHSQETVIESAEFSSELRLAQVKHALTQQDLISAQHLIQQWLQHAPLRADERHAIEQELAQMNAAHYSAAPSDWQPTSLLNLLTQLAKQQRKRPTSTEPLAKL